MQAVDPDIPPVLIGSHIDTQPTGGRFDGAFGVLAALEVLMTLKQAGIVPKRSIRAVAWMNEEGARFAPGMMGSGLFAGQRDLDEVRAARAPDGIELATELARHLDRFRHLERLTLGFPVAAYIEPHIEQANLLQSQEKTIGIVTGIQGKKTWEIVLAGREAHAGTEPLDNRLDALKSFVAMADAMFAMIAAEGEMPAEQVVKPIHALPPGITADIGGIEQTGFEQMHMGILLSRIVSIIG